MFRYFACTWDEASARQCDAALRVLERIRQLTSQWQCVFDIPGCAVYCADEQPRSLRGYVLPENTGVILGSLFQRPTDFRDDSACPRARLDAATAQAFAQSRGQALVDRYWGNYVGITHYQGNVTAVVSPTGSLPCLASPLHGVTWLYSCLADALAVGLPPPVPTHIYVRHAVLGRPPDTDSSLQGVIRLHRGEALDIRPSAHAPGIARRQVWDPHRFTTQDARIDSPQLAASAVRNIVRSCTHTLANDYDHVHLRLSGGLDSSIIAGCLRGVPAAVSCHTYSDLGTSADPRPWARFAAEHGGYPLSEHLVNAATLSLSALDRLRPSADIVSNIGYLFLPELERRLCAAQQSSAVFTGDGGDAGFCSDSDGLALKQYLRHCGLTRNVWALSRHVALATHRLQWQVLRDGIRDWRERSRWSDAIAWNSDDRQLLSHDFAHADREPLNHPWLQSTHEEAALTFYRLGGLTLPIEEPDLSVPTGTFAPEVLHPLSAQPVVELLLRIPVYRHFEEGRDRGLARRAFTRDASPRNLERVWKDRAPGFFSQLIVRNVKWLREVLLDGNLVRARYLDRQKLEQALSIAPSRAGVHPTELLRYLDVELWLRQWHGQAFNRTGPY